LVLAPKVTIAQPALLGPSLQTKFAQLRSIATVVNTSLQVVPLELTSPILFKIDATNVLQAFTAQQAFPMT
jgi:hypothetical protein